MALLATVFLFLTYTEPDAEGAVRPSILLKVLGGWADLAEFDDGDLLPERKELWDEENGLTEYREALASIPEEETEEERKKLAGMRGGREAMDEEYVGEVLARRAALFARVDAMIAKPHIRFPMMTRWDDDLSELFDALTVSNYLALRIRLGGMEKRWQEAVADAETMYAFGTQIIESEGSLVHTLVGIAAVISACREMEMLLRESEFPPALAVEVNRILESEIDYRAAGAFMWRNEYLMFSNIVGDLSRGLGVRELRDGLVGVSDDGLAGVWQNCQDQALLALAFQPERTRKDAAACFKHLIDLTSHSRHERADLDQPERVRTLLRMDSSLYFSTNGVGNLIVMRALPVHGKAITRIDLAKCCPQALRVMCALRRYEAREGSLPTELEALVPRYLKALPADPFTGKSFLYSAKLRRLWSAGEDGKDAGGDERARHFSDSRTRNEPTLHLDWQGDFGN